MRAKAVGTILFGWRAISIIDLNGGGRAGRETGLLWQAASSLR
jgi:hypothetical protein